MDFPCHFTALAFRMLQSPQITNHVLFNDTISRVFRIERSVAVVMGESELRFYNPFNANHQMSGVPFIRHKHEAGISILRVCALYLPSDVSIDAVDPDAMDTRGITEFNLLIYGSDSCFQVLNTARQFVSPKFQIEGIAGSVNVQAMTGNEHRAGEFIISTSSAVLICRLKGNEWITRKVRTEAVSEISCFWNGYLMSQTSGALLMLKDDTISIFIAQDVDQFLVDGDTVVIGRRLYGKKETVIKIVGGSSFAVSGAQKRDLPFKLFDAGNGFIAAIAAPATLVVVNEQDTQKKIQITVPHSKEFPFERVQAVVCGVNSENMIVVHLFATGKALMVLEMSAELLTEDFEEEKQENCNSISDP